MKFPDGTTAISGRGGMWWFDRIDPLTAYHRDFMPSDTWEAFGLVGLGGWFR